MSAVENKALRELLWRATTASLTPEQRLRFLMEAPAQARAGYEECERMSGRKPLEAPRPLEECTDQGHSTPRALALLGARRWSFPRGGSPPWLPVPLVIGSRIGCKEMACTVRARTIAPP